ncbi:MAG: PepSY-associated TM helix domain-containing protein, partial [Opitutales bacterium]
MSPAFRRRLVQLHLWAGLVVGLILLVMALSGAAMIFQPEIEHALHPELSHVAPSRQYWSLDALAARAQADHPQSPVDYLRFFGRDDSPLLVRYLDTDTAYLNPYSGQLIALLPRWSEGFGLIEQLHRFLLVRPSGHYVTGAAALTFLFLFASGVVLWVPSTWRLARRALALRPGRRGRTQWLHWHKLAGIYVGVLVAGSALTGLPQTYDWFQNGIYALTFSPQPESPPHSTVASGKSRASLQSLWEKAAFLVPDAQETILRLPKAPNAAVEVCLIGRSAPHPNARSYVYLDAYSGQVLSFLPYEKSSPGTRLYYLTMSLHDGEIGGLFGKLVLVTSSLGLATLILTGGWSWY